MENLAIYICEKAYGGRKSSSEGIDLEFDKDNKRYIVAVKSGPNWGNSQQIRRMVDNFKQATRIIKTSNSKLNVAAIEGCCYGKGMNEKGHYAKICGQEFWTLISGNENLYIDIIEPLGHQAKKRNDNFQSAYNVIINKFTKEFIDDFCNDGMINWKKLVQFNSSKASIPRPGHV